MTAHIAPILLLLLLLLLLLPLRFLLCLVGEILRAGAQSNKIAWCNIKIKMDLKVPHLHANTSGENIWYPEVIGEQVDCSQIQFMMLMIVMMLMVMLMMMMLTTLGWVQTPTRGWLMRPSIMICLRDKKSLTGIDLQLHILAHPFLMFGHTGTPPPTRGCLEWRGINVAIDIKKKKKIC